MSVSYSFKCDACGTKGKGVEGQYLHPDPPIGWTWRFGSSLEGPHACSRECWDKLKWTDDGKIILHMDHEKLEVRAALQHPPDPQPTPKPVDTRPAGRSWVYFAQRGDSGPIKIGCSTQPISRVKALSAASAEGLTLLGVMPGTQQHERQLHIRFTACRLNGEWFRPDEALRQYIAEHAQQLPA